MPAYAVLAAGSHTADVVLSPEAAAQGDRCARTFMTVVLLLLLRRVGWHHLHAAAAVAPDGRAWLFAGNARAGKSTTAALLATRGWGVGGDDLSYLVESADGVRVVSQHAPIALRPGGLALLGTRANGTPTKDGRKTAFLPKSSGATGSDAVARTF